MTARARWEEGVAVRRMIGDPLLSTALSYLGQVAREQEDYASAQTWLEESLALSEAAGDQRDSARTLDRLGTIAHALGDYSLARSRYEQSLALARQVSFHNETLWSLHNLGCLALDQGDLPEARESLAQGLTSRVDEDKIGFVHRLAEFACLAAAEGLPAAAVRLAGASAALIQQTGIALQHSERGRYERWLATARQALGDAAAAIAWAEGQQMRLDQAIAHAVAPHELEIGGEPVEPQPDRGSSTLTQRQREVAVLIARGRSNRQIGEELVITERTVAAHIEHILDKPNCSAVT